MEIILRKYGNFYSAFDDDAVILHSLFGYKLKDGRVGFPVSSIEKVICKLEELHINYKTYDNSLSNSFDDNKYNLILAESRNKEALDYKIKKIEEIINKLNFNELSDLIELIEGFVNERRKVWDNTYN